MKRPDISDRLLAYLVFAAGLSLIVWFAFLSDRSPDWRLPGSPRLYRTGVLGSVLLLVSFAFVLAKRTGAGGSPVRWFSAHIVSSVAGSVLVAIHSAGYLRYAPALLLLALAGLAGLGVWARIQLSRRISATFGSKHESFSPLDESDRGRLRALIGEKEKLLERLSPGAGEGTFSLTLADWLAHPALARAYARLAAEETGLLGTRSAVGPAQAHWRRLHMALAAIFLLGLAGHVIAVTFFAGYVAGGREVYWWHLTKW